LDTAALLTAWTPCRDRPRIGLKPSGRQLQYGFQQRWGCRAPCPENTFFVIGEAVITMCLRLLQQRSAELYQRLYDLVREVVYSHVAFPDPPLLLTTAGLFV
jgi:hypothetical protein